MIQEAYGPQGYVFEEVMSRGQRRGNRICRHLSIEAYFMAWCSGDTNAASFTATCMWLILRRPGDALGHTQHRVWRAFYKRHRGAMVASKRPEVLALLQEFDAESSSADAMRAINEVVDVW